MDIATQPNLYQISPLTAWIAYSWLFVSKKLSKELYRDSTLVILTIKQIHWIRPRINQPIKIPWMALGNIQTRGRPMSIRAAFNAETTNPPRRELNAAVRLFDRVFGKELGMDMVI
jgi:hypothetical protein